MSHGPRRHSIALYYSETDTYVVTSMFYVEHPPAITYIDVGNIKLRLKLLKITKSGKPLYEVKKIPL